MPEIEIHGLDQLQRQLAAIAKEYTDKDAKGTMAFAMRRTMRVVRDEVKKNVPYDNRPGADDVHLRDNIVVRTAKKRDTPHGMTRVMVGIRNRDKNYVNNKKNRAAGRVGGQYKDYGKLYYAMMVEFGTSRAAPNRFMRKSWSASSGKLPGILKSELANSIQRTIKRLSK